MKRQFRFLSPILVTVIFLAVMGLLYEKLKHYPYSDFEAGLHLITLERVLAAIGLTGLYYLILVGYDLVAIRYGGHRLPLAKVALASFTGYAGSYNFGALLGGASVRYRLYSLWGLSALEIAQVVLVVGLTFWIGVFALGGVVFLAKPFAVPPDLHLPVANAWTLGLILALALAGYLGLCAFRSGRPLRWFDRELSLPPLTMGLVQAGIASADLMVGAAVFHLLVAPVLDVGYTAVLGVYLLSLVAGIITQVPGGMGVFELSILLLLAPADPPKLFAAMAVWRAIFYLLPLAVAALVLGIHEIALRISRGRGSRDGDKVTHVPVDQSPGG